MTGDRQAKVDAMLAVLDEARDRSAVTWSTVAERLAGYDAAAWRSLVAATGRPSRTPSEVTKRLVLREVRRRAADAAGLVHEEEPHGQAPPE